MELVGKSSYDFADRVTGEQVKGVTLYFLYPDSRVSGMAADKKSFQAGSALYEKAAGLALGEFDFLYNPKGRVMDIVQGGPGRK